MPRGGARAGSGRKTNEEREQIRTAGARKLQRFAEKALDDLDVIYEAQKDLALGIYFLGCSQCGKEPAKCRCRDGGPYSDEDGELQKVRVYRRPPDQRAGAELLQHAKGRAAQAQQVNPETSITVSLGCKRCGGYEPLIPRPPQTGKGENKDAEGAISGRLGHVDEDGKQDQGAVGGPEDE